MKGYQSRRTNSIGRRVRVVHRKAKFVGSLYLIATLALVALAYLFPVLVVNGQPLDITNFYLPFTTVMSGELNWLALVTSASYALILLVGAINVLKSLSLLGRLLKETSRYNRNMRAMDGLGKAYSSTFAVILSLYLQMYLLQPVATAAILWVNGAIILGVAVFFHFLCGIWSAKVSRFYIDENKTVAEETRECGVFTYFFRNLMQIAAIGGIAYYMAETNELYRIIAIVEGLLAGMFDLNVVIVVGLQLLMLLCMFVMIKHATAATEYNLYGIEGKGMKNYRVFSFLVFAAAAGLFVWTYLQTQIIALGYAIIAGVALVVFLLDCFVKTRQKKVEKDENDLPVKNKAQRNDAVAPMNAPAPVVAPAPMASMPTQQQPIYIQGATQPVYVPIYYPYPQQPAAVAYPYPVAYSAPAAQEQPAAVALPVPEYKKPEPAPAPAHIQPTPSPIAAREEAEEKAKQAEKQEEKPMHYDGEVKEMPATLDPTKKYTVRCPNCGTKVQVTQATPFHRCPVCDKVFTLRTFEAYTKKN
ncbi:MAG: hypothetical protein J6A63_06145 [Clostridia bacterium]|nr:hypothetical protein [Clostridia bacterium]